MDADVPDTLVARFVDILDHVQHRLLHAQSERISLMQKSIDDIQEMDIAAVLAQIQTTMDQQDQKIVQLQNSLSMRDAIIEGHDERLASLTQSLSRPPALASHRGPGALPLRDAQPRAHQLLDEAGLEEAESRQGSVIIGADAAGPVVALTPGASLAVATQDANTTTYALTDATRKDVIDTISEIDSDMRAVVPAVNQATKHVDELRTKTAELEKTIDMSMNQIKDITTIFGGASLRERLRDMDQNLQTLLCFRAGFREATSPCSSQPRDPRSQRRGHVRPQYSECLGAISANHRADPGTNISTPSTRDDHPHGQLQRTQEHDGHLRQDFTGDCRGLH